MRPHKNTVELRPSFLKLVTNNADTQYTYYVGIICISIDIPRVPLINLYN